MWCSAYFLFSLQKQNPKWFSFSFTDFLPCTEDIGFPLLFPSLICLYRLRICLCPLGWDVLLGLDLDLGPTNRSQAELTFLRTEWEEVHHVAKYLVQPIGKSEHHQFDCDRDAIWIPKGGTTKKAFFQFYLSNICFSQYLNICSGSRTRKLREVASDIVLVIKELTI